MPSNGNGNGKNGNGAKNGTVKNGAAKNGNGPSGIIQIAEPAVTARCAGDLEQPACRNGYEADLRVSGLSPARSGQLPSRRWSAPGAHSHAPTGVRLYFSLKFAEIDEPSAIVTVTSTSNRARRSCSNATRASSSRP